MRQLPKATTLLVASTYAVVIGATQEDAAPAGGVTSCAESQDHGRSDENAWPSGVFLSHVRAQGRSIFG